MELKDALKILFEKKGRDILKDPVILKGYLMDIAPEHAKVISVLSQASASHIFDDIAVCEEKELSVCLNHAVLRMYELYAKKPTDTIKEALIYALAPTESVTEKKDSEETNTNTKQEENRKEMHEDKKAGKKWLPVLLVTALIIGLATVFSKMNNNSAETAEPKVDEAYDIDVIIGSEEDGYMSLYLTELTYYFKSLETEDVTYNVNIVYSNSDHARQLSNMSESISQGRDIIIMDLLETSDADYCINKTVSAGIPLILINHEPLGENGDESYSGIINHSRVCFIGEDPRSAGVAQGEIIAALPDHGDLNGDGIISYLMLKAEYSKNRYRTEFSVKALEDADLKTECIDEQTGLWGQEKSQMACRKALNQYGDKIEVVFCDNDEIALGAAKAIVDDNRTVGKDIYLVGIDGLEECVDMVDKGEMTGTVMEDYIDGAHTTADVATKLMNDENIDNYYWIDYLKIVK